MNNKCLTNPCEGCPIWASELRAEDKLQTALGAQAAAEDSSTVQSIRFNSSIAGMVDLVKPFLNERMREDNTAAHVALGAVLRKIDGDCT